MQRIVRATSLAGLGSLVGMAAYAAQGSNSPIVTGVSSWIVSPGQQVIVSGDHFSNDAFTADCKISGAPVVIFEAMDGTGHTFGVNPASANAADCSNTAVKVAVPGGFSGSGRVKVQDSGGKPSRDNLMITIQPSASLSPASGQVGTSVTINGTGLHPASVAPAPNGQLHLVYPGIDTHIANWGDQVGFSPGNSSGSAQLDFQVSTNTDAPSANLQTVTVPAGSYQFLPPTAAGGSIGGKVVGDRLTISGANLGSGGSVGFSGGAGGQGIAWSSSQVGVTIPPGAQDGPITLSVSGYGNIAGPSVSLKPLVKAMSPTSGSAGSVLTITGYNFGSGAGHVTANGVDQAVSSWSDQAVAFTVGGDTDSGAVSITRADGATAAAPSVSIVPRLDKLESNNVRAGSPIVVDGVSLGAATGTAAVGGAAATPQLWSRTSVLLALPGTLKPGAYPLVLTSASGAASNPLTITIAPGPAAPPSRSSAGGQSPSVFIDNNHQFHKPEKSVSPVQLSLSANPHKTKAGGTAALTMTLTLNGKPVSGAEIKLRMLFSPGADYGFTPATGITDQAGTFTAKVRVSKVTGDSIIQAESGVFSDQDHVQGTGGEAPLSTVNPANTGGIVPLLGLGLLALALVVVGVWMNLRSIRSAAS